MPLTDTDLSDYDLAALDPVCECELDWSCGLHAGNAPFIDRRYQGTVEDEARQTGEPF